MIHSELDFRLLSIFRALIEKKQVSAAAEHLGMAQPTVSRGLAKLRKHFDDPLFVRTQYSMEPTPLAIELEKPIDEIVHLYQHALAQGPAFNPLTSERHYSIAASEVGHVLLFSRLIPELEKQAPSVSLYAAPLEGRSLIQELESGSTDCAFGHYPKLSAGIHERKLYKEEYVCLARKEHPLIQDSLTKEHFHTGKHIIVSAQRLGHIHEEVESKLIRSCGNQNIKVITHNFLSAALMAENTDAIVTLPSGAAQALNHRQRLRAFKPPIALPNFEVKLYWHERYHRDPAHQWLRKLIYSLFEASKPILTQSIVSN